MFIEAAMTIGDRKICNHSKPMFRCLNYAKHHEYKTAARKLGNDGEIISRTIPKIRVVRHILLRTCDDVMMKSRSSHGDVRVASTSVETGGVAREN
jgi:hypothetical protein